MKNTPFKLKSGNTTPFKQMGSSKALQAKIAKEFKLPVSQKSSMPKNFNIKGDPSTTPGYSSTKMAKAAAQGKAVDKLATRTDLSKVDFEKKLAKITRTVDPYPSAKKSSMPKNFNIKGGPAKPDFSKWAKSIDPRAKNILTKKEIAKKLTNRVKTAVKQEGMKATKNLAKVGKFLGGKTLGVAGMMMATSAKATQPGTGTHGGTKVPKLKDIDKK